MVSPCDVVFLYVYVVFPYVLVEGTISENSGVVHRLN
jgi:hypothetical protein